MIRALLLRAFGLLATVAAVAVPAADAAETYRSLIVDQTDGSRVYIELTDRMQAVFGSGIFRVTGVSAMVSIPQASIKSFAFSETSALAGVAAPGSEPVFANGCISFSDLPANSVVTVADPSGKIIATHKPVGSWTLDLTTLNAGIYIITVNGTSYKIATKS